MVKNTECFKYYQMLFSNAQMLAMLPVFNSRRCSKGILKIIQFPKMTEEKKLSGEYFE